MQINLPDLYWLMISRAEAAWVNKRYHGHCMLLPIILVQCEWALPIN